VVGEALECLRELGWIRAEVADAPLQPLSFSMGCWPHGSRASSVPGRHGGKVTENSHLMLMNLVTRGGESDHWQRLQAGAVAAPVKVSARPDDLRSLAIIVSRKATHEERREDRLEKATYQPGDFGRMIRPDGTEQWWVRSSKGTWVALRHQRVMPNDDGSITLLLLER
jgi:hypothetical protein